MARRERKSNRLYKGDPSQLHLLFQLHPHHRPHKAKKVKQGETQNHCLLSANWPKQGIEAFVRISCRIRVISEGNIIDTPCMIAIKKRGGEVVCCCC
mmetsp:Transcript_37320/g.48288  ORF Transcript_37320/g.48288 Transcript_37320/m.48288 type:complete len:97 (+) Transcript_37320:510-800(+)